METVVGCIALAMKLARGQPRTVEEPTDSFYLGMCVQVGAFLLSSDAVRAGK